MFTFFLKSYRLKILDFCGSKVEVEFDINKEDGKYCVKQFENGEIDINTLQSKHSNILKGVIIGKKSWGLFVEEWSNGIVEWLFVKEEILKQFEDKKIEVPDSLLNEFDNLIEKKKKIRNLKELERIKNH